MNTMAASLTLYLLNAVWQIPLVFAAAWIAARLARPIGPRTEHRIWAAALIIEVVLPALRIDRTARTAALAALSGWWQSAVALFSRTFGSHSASSEVRVLMGPANASGNNALHLSNAFLSAILIAYAATVLYFVVRLAWGLLKTRAMRRNAQPIVSSRSLHKLSRCLEALAIDQKQITVAASASISGPATVGMRNPTLLLPEGFLERISEDDLRAILAHEHAHMRRHDFTLNLLYELIALATSFHPIVWLTRARLAESREMVCDEIAAGTLAATTGRQHYAQSLLRLASMLATAKPTLHAIGIFDANIFERRVMHLTRKPKALPRARRYAIAAACAILALTTATSAIGLRINAISSAQEDTRPPKLKVDINKLTLVSKAQPEYPVEEKKKHKSGKVVLAAVIGKDGQVEHLSVDSTPGEDFSQSAMDAVRQWRFQPYLLNGDPIEVETTINIIYNLGK
jgi:TonB family protein